MAPEHKSEAGTARFAFFSKREAVFDAIERGELPKKVWRREFATSGSPAISYAQFMRLFNKFAPSHLQVLLGKKSPVKISDGSPIKPPAGAGLGAPKVASSSGRSITTENQPERTPTYGRTNRSPYKFGDLKIDLNEVFGSVPEKKPDK